METKNVAARLIGKSMIDRVNLRSCDLTNLDFRGVRFNSCDLRNANFDGSNLNGANFDTSDIEGATYGVAEFTCNFVQLLGLEYPIYFFKNHIKIGCQLHTIAEWEKFTDDEIDEFDNNAFEFWNNYKLAILTIAKTNGAGA